MFTLLKMYFKKAKLCNKLCSLLLLFSIIVGLFTTLTLSGVSADTAKIPAIKVKKTDHNPYFVQTVWLEPNTEYEFSYLYSDTLPDVDVAVKGTNEKKFTQTKRVFDTENKKVTIGFTTSSLDDSEATVGTGDNAGKLQALVGIRIYASSTAAVGSYYAGFTVYKKSDANKTNLFADTEYSSYGAKTDGYIWNGLWGTDIKNNFEKANVDESLFEAEKVNKDSIRAVKVKKSNNPANPYFVQTVWLEPNTEYVFSYLYSLRPADAEIMIKGDNEKQFSNTSRVLDEYDKLVTRTFTTSGLDDSEATLGTGDNAGKIMAYIGVRLWNNSTDLVDSYFADFQLYKKSDVAKTNVFTDVEFTSIGARDLNRKWHGMFETANCLIAFGGADLDDKSIFKIKDKEEGFPAIKVVNTSWNPYFAQTVWLEPNTEYQYSYMYSDNPANAVVMMKAEDKNFSSGAAVLDAEKNKLTYTFTTCGLDDEFVIKGTGDNEGKLMAYIGIRFYKANTAAVGTYFAGFELYKKGDTQKNNLLNDNNYNNIGVNGTATWHGVFNGVAATGNFNKVILDDDSMFARKFGVLCVDKGAKTYIGQWRELKANTKYVSTFYFSPTIDSSSFKADKNMTWDSHFKIDSITLDETYLKATIEFTPIKDEVTNAFSVSQNYTGNEVLTYVGFCFTASDNGYIYDLQLYEKSDTEKTNLFDDPKFTNLDSKSDGGKWYIIDGSEPHNRFNVTSLEAIGGIDVFLCPDVSGSGQYVLKANGAQNPYLLQQVSLEPKKTYYYSYYYRNASTNTFAMIVNGDPDNGVVSANVTSSAEDNEWFKVTHKFTSPAIGEKGAVADPTNPNKVLVDIGIRAVKGKTQYFYDFKLWNADDQEKTNILLDNNFEYFGYKWKQVYWIETEVFSRISLASLEGGIEYFKLPSEEQLTKADGTDYAIKTDGLKNPFLFQKVSLDPNKTYAFSFYHINKISQDVYSGEARLFKALIDKGNLPEENIVSVVDDKEWNKTTTTFTPFQLTDEGVTEDINNSGNVIMYVGVRCWEEVMYYYGFELYDVDDPEKKNILVDLDFEYLGYTWIQMYWTEAERFTRIPVENLDRGVEYFKKLRGPDISVGNGPKMMTYGSNGTEGTLFIDLPYTVKKNQTTGKYYIVTVSIRPTEGRSPINFVTSNYKGGTTNVAPISIDGYKYTFYLQERYDFRLGITFARNTSGYISCLGMYEADNDQNITGNKNLATAFGKDGMFSDWDIQSGLRWFDLTGGSVGTYPGELPEDYTGRTTGKLVAMPEGYMTLEDPGVWWNSADVDNMAVGTVNGIVKTTDGKAVSGAKIKLLPMSGGEAILAFTDKYGKFIMNNVPIGGYDFYIVEDNGNEILYMDGVWIETNGDVVNLNLTYNGNGINVDKTIVTTGIVKGYIVDKNGNPIIGLTLLLDTEDTWVVTDENGYYEFKDVTPGIHSIIIKAENGKMITIANIMVNEGVSYQLQTSDGGPLIYDKDAKSVNNNSSVKQDYHNNDDKAKDTNLATIIIIVSVSVFVIVGGIIAFVLVKRRKQNY